MAKFTEKHLHWSLFLIKLQTWESGVFLLILPCFKNTYFAKFLRMLASIIWFNITKLSRLVWLSFPFIVTKTLEMYFAAKIFLQTEKRFF